MEDLMRFGLLSLVVLASACTPRINTDPVTGAVDLDVQPAQLRSRRRR